MSGIRVAYITPERELGTARGKRRAFAQLEAAGLLDAVTVISPELRRLIDGGTGGLLSEVRAFRPSIIFLEHPSSRMLTSADLRGLRTVPGARLVVYEMDVYDRHRKKYPAVLREAAALSDVILTPGASTQLTDYRRFGARHAVWQPSSFNPADFGLRPIYRIPSHDVVMIANDSSSRAPFRSMPGSRQRVRLVQGLHRRFGDRFALYGSGWPKGLSRGPIGFMEQERVIQQGRISVNFDHYPHEAMFFSNRLPITLASGSVHVTTAHAGYEKIFARHTGEFLHLHVSPAKIIDRVESLLACVDDSALLERGERARRFAFEHFREDELLLRALGFAGARISRDSARHVWELPVGPLTDY